MKLQRKIVAIKPKGQKRPKRLIIFADKSVFEISEDVFVSTALKVGQEVDDQYLSTLEEKESYHNAFHASLSLLNYRMRSKAELERRLKEKSFSDKTIINVLLKLEEKNILDDEAFARAFIKDKIRSRFLGPIAIRSELFPHKLENELIDKLMQNAYEENSEEGLVERLLEKRKISKGQNLTQKERNRLLSYFQRRGHTWGVIKNVLEKWDI